MFLTVNCVPCGGRPLGRDRVQIQAAACNALNGCKPLFLLQNSINPGAQPGVGGRAGGPAAGQDSSQIRVRRAQIVINDGEIKLVPVGHVADSIPETSLDDLRAVRPAAGESLLQLFQ
jgi:hypothetical protein